MPPTTRRPAAPLSLVVAALVLLASVAGCGGDDAAGDGATDGTTTTTERERDGQDDDQRGQEGDDGNEEGEGEGRGCSNPTPGAAEGLSADVVELTDDVSAVVYPHPDYDARLWSQWGQGLVLADGRYLSAMGDHCGAGGNAYLYAFDPATGRLEVVGDVLAAAGLPESGFGYGKIHAQLVPGPDGVVYAATYWGTRNGLEYGDGYDGDLLLRFDPANDELTALGVPVEHHGVPSLAGWTEGGLLYGEAVDPGSDPDDGTFFVYDTARQSVVFESDADHVGFRNVMVDGDGTAYFSAGEGRLHAYDPEAGELRLLDERIPGERLRASSRPAPDGTVYGVTNDPAVLFALRPGGEIDEIGPLRGDTASLALSADGSRLYYVPGTHGEAYEQGTPLIAVDTATGDDEVVVELNPLTEEMLDLRVGGSYNVALDPSGRRAYVGLNAGEPGAHEPFGEVVLAVIDL